MAPAEAKGIEAKEDTEDKKDPALPASLLASIGGPAQHRIAGFVRGLPVGAEVTVDLRAGSTVHCDGIDVVLFKGRESHRIQEDGTFEFDATIDEDAHYRLDINANGAPDPNEDDATATPHRV